MSTPNAVPLPDLQSFNDEQLVVVRALLEIEMKKRGVAFSIGDIGERLTIDHFNSTPGLPNLQSAPTGTKNVDALSRSGDRYSIKTLWKAKKTGTIYPDPDEPEKQLFERLLIVRLDNQLGLTCIYEFGWRQFLAARKWDKRMNAWYVPLSNRSLALGTLVPGFHAEAKH